MKHKKGNPWGRPVAATVVPSASTGPVTAEGKEIASQNALKHGCTATSTLILSTEDPQAFKALESVWFRSYEPKDAAETHLVHELVEADWFLQRANRAFRDKEAALYNEAPDVGDWTEEQQKSIGRFLRYRTTHTNAVAKRRKAIEDYRRCRQLEQSRDQAIRHKEERLALAKAKVDILANKRSRSAEPKRDHLTAVQPAKQAGPPTHVVTPQSISADTGGA